MGDFLQKLKKWSVSCYTDWLLANQIAGKPVCISCHVIMSIIHGTQDIPHGIHDIPQGTDHTVYSFMTASAVVRKPKRMSYIRFQMRFPKTSDHGNFKSTEKKQ